MGSGLLDLPMKLLMPSSFDNAKEIAFKTITSISKVDIKTVMESTYGVEVKKVRTLNMQGKKKRSGCLIARPNYKKAYVTLKNPISFASDIASKGSIWTQNIDTLFSFTSIALTMTWIDMVIFLIEGRKRNLCL